MRLRDAAPVNDWYKPVGVGLATGLALFLLPEAVGLPILLLGAVLAGWLLPTAPLAAAALFLVPTAVLGAVRLLSDDAGSAGTLVGALVSAVLVAAVCTHVGAGLALRRERAAG